MEQISRVQQDVIMVGAFPPPVHGMALVNIYVKNSFEDVGVTPRIINIASPNLKRSLRARLGRLPKILMGLTQFVSAGVLKGGTLYMSVSGGLGQFYEILFVLLARLRGMRLFLHHHSFAYLDKPSRLTSWLIRSAGNNAVHVTQSPKMAEKLNVLYGVKHTIAISNAVFLLGHKAMLVEPRKKLKTLGYISNISMEKGIFEFINLIEALQDAGLILSAKLAGPFQDTETESRVRSLLPALPCLEYVGPKFAAGKDAFFSEIDVLIFPSRYENETEGIVNHEAMMLGIPVIAYGRGCIPEIIDSDCGKVIDPADPFVPEAMEQIKTWLGSPSAFEAASRAASRRFAGTYVQNEQRWKELLGNLTDSLSAKPIKTEAENSPS